MLTIAHLSIGFMFTSKCTIAMFIYDAKREFPSLLSQNDKRMPKEGEKKTVGPYAVVLTVARKLEFPTSLLHPPLRLRGSNGQRVRSSVAAPSAQTRAPT